MAAYQTGKFRDVEFYTVTSVTTFGRRTATYELPFDEQGVAHIDLGRAARRFQINAILISNKLGPAPGGTTGNALLKVFGIGGPAAAIVKTAKSDYTVARDALIKAIETRGPGQLVHPTLGSHMVVVKGDVTITESTEMGGMCEISFQAIESRDPLPAEAGGGLLDAIAEVKASAAAEFAEKLVTQGPDFLLADVTAVMDNACNALKIANSTITSVLATPALLTSRINDISLQMAQLLQTPRKAFDAMDGFIESLAASAGRVFDASKQEDVEATLAASKIVRNAETLGFSLVNLSLPGLPIPVELITPARNQQRKNRAAMAHGLKASLLGNSAGGLAETPPKSRTEALDVGNKLAKMIVELADGSVEGVEMGIELYDSLKQLAAAVQDYCERVAGETANVRVIRLAAPTPVEVLAHKLYGDAERATEILERNTHVAHGGMLPGQSDLEVLDR